MNAKLYIDKGVPFVALEAETLTDGSVAWNLCFRNGDTIHCLSEDKGDHAFALIAKALTVATGERPLTL